MFLVTWDHASQVISNSIFNNLLGGGNLVAVHMPLFFIISGYFIDLEKIRGAKILPFVKNKFEHLMIPAIVWTSLYCLLTMTMKGPLTFLSFYWYLFSLFLSFVVIVIFSKLINNNTWAILLSTVVIMFTPYIPTISNLNFMFPFLWVGYLLRVHPPKQSSLWFAISLIITAGLFLIWNWDYTVYLSRFNTAILSVDMLIKCVVRFAMGVSSSYVIMYLAQRFEGICFINNFSKYGQYTLITYLASLVLFGVMRKYLPIGIDQPVLLEFFSLLLCVATYALCILLQKGISKKKYLRLGFLGISK